MFLNSTTQSRGAVPKLKRIAGGMGERRESERSEGVCVRAHFESAGSGNENLGQDGVPSRERESARARKGGEGGRRGGRKKKDLRM